MSSVFSERVNAILGTDCFYASHLKLLLLAASAMNYKTQLGVHKILRRQLMLRFFVDR